jgi:hypothetical protein
MPWFSTLFSLWNELVAGKTRSGGGLTRFLANSDETKDTKVHKGIKSSALPLCNFVSSVVNGPGCSDPAGCHSLRYVANQC